MRSRRAALFGSTSRVGPGIVNAFAKSSTCDLTIILRPGSKRPKLPAGSEGRIKLYTLSNDDPTTSDLIKTFEELDCTVVISALNAALVDLHKSIADACVQAGVSRFIPADYGSVRSDDVFALDLMQNFRNKAFVRWHCQRLAEDNPSFTWTSMATGHFFDYGLKTELLGFDVEKGTMLQFDDGEKPWSASTVDQIGRAVVKVLEHEDKTANKMILVQSFVVTQKQVQKAIESVTGKSLKVEKLNGKKYMLDESAKGAAGDAEAIEAAVCVMGILRSYWEGDEAFANELLGLEEEDLDEVVKSVLG